MGHSMDKKDKKSMMTLEMQVVKRIKELATYLNDRVLKTFNKDSEISQIAN